jgi:two-component system phosphate regulon sensor histidine kinase PhoR
LYPPFLFILLIALTLLTLYDAVSLGKLYRADTELQLERMARFVAVEAVRLWPQGSPERFETFAREAGRASSFRVTLLSDKGAVLGDSEVEPASMDDHHDRIEIREAMAGKIGRSTRFSFTTRRETMYVAAPIVRDATTVGFVRVGADVHAVMGAVRPVFLRLLLWTSLIAVLAVALGLLASRKLAREVEAIARYAEGYARDETGERLPISDGHGLAEVARALNRMGSRFEERLKDLQRQRNELESVLSGMVEGVIAVDAEARVINLNEAAARILMVSRSEAAGRSIQEVVRNNRLQRIVERTLAGSEPLEDDITLFFERERTLKARGTVLREGSGRVVGAVVVLDDVTKLRRLEASRREFVANVSHEIRTPITSIQGYVETLLDGALDDRETAERFLRTVLAQAGRLNALVNDLLALARLEQDEKSAVLTRETVRLRELVDSAVRVCEPLASSVAMRIEAGGDSELSASVNAALVEQAIVNLLDNAIKYSAPGSEVRVEIAQEGTEAQIRVIDRGCGIEPQHLPRLFERFYRVDRARSREQGGTGLGLAIVKHIALLHKGSATVESTPGQGSTFALHLPLDGTR